MAEKVARLGLNREKDFIYYIKEGAVWKVPSKRAGQAKGKAEKVKDSGVTHDAAYIYFLDSDGDVARAKRAIGGQPRKKSARGSAKAAKKATKKPVKKAAAKKPAKKAAAKKPAKKPVKKGKKR